MNFSINKNILYNILNILSKAIPKRSTLPIINCALFTQTNNMLNIRTTDLEISISINCDVEGENTGSIAIPINKLLEITNAIPEGIIKVNVSDIGKVNIECEKGKYTIMGQPKNDFPIEQEIEGGKPLTLEVEEIKNIINNTAYAASKDDLKPVLQGGLFKINDEGFVSVATDGHRLVKFEKTNVNTNNFNGTVVVPTKFLFLLHSLLEENTNTSMIVGENHIQIQINNATITSRIIKETFPDYEGVIPKDNENTLVVDKNMFTEAVKRVSIFSNKASKQVALNISENNLTITTEDPENITSGKEELECEYQGEPMTIGYNALYLKEVLQHQQSNEIKILLKSPLNAGLFLPIEQKQNENKTTLLMPIRLND